MPISGRWTRFICEMFAPCWMGYGQRLNRWQMRFFAIPAKPLTSVSTAAKVNSGSLLEARRWESTKVHHIVSQGLPVELFQTVGNKPRLQAWKLHRQGKYRIFRGADHMVAPGRRTGNPVGCHRWFGSSRVGGYDALRGALQWPLGNRLDDCGNWRTPHAPGWGIIRCLPTQGCLSAADRCPFPSQTCLRAYDIHFISRSAETWRALAK